MFRNFLSLFAPTINSVDACQRTRNNIIPNWYNMVLKKGSKKNHFFIGQKNSIYSLNDGLNPENFTTKNYFLIEINFLK